MKTTLVINPKGGSGKTTVAINLAACFAAENIPTTLMDYDPQASSLTWLRSRGPNAPMIYAANGAPEKYGRLRSFEMLVPPHTQQLKLLTRLLDSDMYLKAAESGVGIFEMDAGQTAVERRQFTPIVDWVRGEAAMQMARVDGAGTEVQLVRRVAF